MCIVPHMRAFSGSEDSVPANTPHLETSLKTSYFSKLLLDLIRTANGFAFVHYVCAIFCHMVLFQSRDLKWFDWAAAAFGSANTVEGKVCAIHQITNLYYICLFHADSQITYTPLHFI